MNFTNYTTADGLGDNFIFDVFVDNINTYFSTSSGLSIGALPTVDVPTLSEWGLLILALMLMTAGTLYLVQPNMRFEQER